MRMSATLILGMSWLWKTPPDASGGAGWCSGLRRRARHSRPGRSPLRHQRSHGDTLSTTRDSPPGHVRAAVIRRRRPAGRRAPPPPAAARRTVLFGGPPVPRAYLHRRGDATRTGKPIPRPAPAVTHKPPPASRCLTPTPIGQSPPGPGPATVPEPAGVAGTEPNLSRIRAPSGAGRQRISGPGQGTCELVFRRNDTSLGTAGGEGDARVRPQHRAGAGELDGGARPARGDRQRPR